MEHSYAALRKLARLARDLHTRSFKWHGQDAIIVEATHPRQFRRAYVEAALRAPFAVERRGDGWELEAGSESVGTVDDNQQVTIVNTWVSPLALSPCHLNTLAGMAWSRFCDRVRSRYDELLSGSTAGEAPRLEIYEDVGGYGQIRIRKLRGLAIRAVKEFSAHLDPEALHTLRRNYLDLPSEHCAKTVHAVTCPVNGRWWRQAFAAYPAIMSIACRGVDCFDGLERVVASQAPLVPFLSTCLELEQAAIRRFSGVTRQRMGFHVGPDFLRFIASLPQHLRPRKQRDYRAAIKLWTQVSASQQVYGMDPDCLALTRGMKVALGDEPRINALDGLQDVVGCLHQLCEDAAVIFSAHHARIFAATIGQLSLGRLVDLNVDWHRAHRVATQEASEMAGAVPGDTDPCWPGMLTEAITFGNIRAVELCSISALMQEGQALQHCVAGYYPQCFAGTSRIVSLRNPDGTSRSTIEFGLKRGSARDPLRLRIVQHGCHRDRSVVLRDRQVARQLLGILRQDRGLAPWPRLPCPERAGDRVSRLLEESMRAFMHERFPVLADLDVFLGWVPAATQQQRRAA